MKSNSKSKIAFGFCIWLTVFSAIAFTPASSFEQTLVKVENRNLQPGRDGRYRYYSGYLGLSDHLITVEATADAPIYILLIDSFQQNISNQATYYSETNYINATDDSDLFTKRWTGTEFDLSWREESDERMFIIIQNEGTVPVSVSFLIIKSELSTMATYFGIGSVILLTAIFVGLLTSRKKVGASEEETPAPAA
ncbi:MAG: hypothetical protein ACTSWW_04675 [Promethearchaeota archaeon]